jgi:hypothetical protein
MRDDSVLAAIDAALPSPEPCGCGRHLTVAVRDGGVWLECSAFGQPSRLPAKLATAVRGLLHDRRFLVRAAATAG